MVTLIILFLGIASIGLYLGKLLTEHPKYNISQIHPTLERKPFNCRSCLSFHILFSTYTTTAYIIDSWRFFILGGLFSIILFGLLYNNSNQRTT